MPRIASLTSRSLTGIVAQLTPDTQAEYLALSLDQASYNEGTGIIATLNSANIPNGTTVAYTVTGMSFGDLVSGATSGTFTINSNIAFREFVLNNDGLTEGTDTFTITLAATDSLGNATGALVASASILDTSNDPTTSLWLDSSDAATTVRLIIGSTSMQINGAFASNPSVPRTIEGRSSGTRTTITAITARTANYIEVDDSGNSTNFIVGEQLNLVTIAYSVVPASPSVNEGSSLTFNVTTTNLPDGTTLYWTTTSTDLSASSGSFTLTNNAGSFSVTPTADASTEGPETFTVNVRTGSITGTVVATSSSVTINDTSLSPTYSISPAANNVNEGSSLTFNVTTTNVSNGTTLFWAVSRTGDFVTNTGSFTINSNAGSFSVTPTADNTTEGAETFTVSIRTLSLVGPIVATSSSVTINDTSITPTTALLADFDTNLTTDSSGRSVSIATVNTVTTGGNRFGSPGSSANVSLGYLTATGGNLINFSNWNLDAATNTNWTIEFSFNIGLNATNAPTILYVALAGGRRYGVFAQANGTLLLMRGDTGVSTTQAYNDGQWHHCSLVRGNGNVYLRIDGVHRATVAANSAGVNADQVRFGNVFGGQTANTLSIDDIRISEGLRYPADTTTVTAPSAEFPPILLVDAVTGTSVSSFFTFPNGVSIDYWNDAQVLNFSDSGTSTVLSKAMTTTANSDYSFEIIFNAGSNPATFIFNKPFLIAAGVPTPPYTMFALAYGGGNLSWWRSNNFSGNSSDVAILENNWYYMKYHNSLYWLYNITAGAWVAQNTVMPVATDLQTNATLWLGGQPTTYANNPQVEFNGQIAMARFSQPANTTVPTSVPNYTRADVTANDKVFIVKG